MHRDTGKDQGKKFFEAPVGTLFYLCHGNSPQRVGQFTSEAVPCEGRWLVTAQLSRIEVGNPNGSLSEQFQVLVSARQYDVLAAGPE